MKPSANRLFRRPVVRCAALLLPLLAAHRALAFEPDEAPLSNQGTVAGAVIFRGAVPTMPIADAAGKRQPLLTIDRRTRGLRHAVVYLTGNAPEQAIPVERQPVVIDQKEYAFIPRLTAIHQEQAVRFTNSDPANHNVRAIAVEPANQFNVMTGAAKEYIHHFQAPSTVRPIRLGCDIHSWMRAWIYVFDHDRFTVTDRRGRFRIENVPPGKYTLHVQQPDGGLRTKREIEVTPSPNEAMEIEFTESELKPAQ